MRAFLNQPVEPQTGVIECMIRRKKGVMNTVYQAYYEVSNALKMRTMYFHRWNTLGVWAHTGHVLFFGLARFWQRLSWSQGLVSLSKQNPVTKTFPAPAQTVLCNAAYNEAPDDGQEGQGSLHHRDEP